MAFLKAKIEKTDSVTRQEFEALAEQLESFKTIATVAVAAIGMAMKGPPGLPDSDARKRLEKLAAVADLDAAASAQLKNFFQLLDMLNKAESRRQVAEERKRALPRTFDTVRVPSWRG